MITHRCRCGVDYECPFCETKESFVCPTLNGDENANTCDECEAAFAEEYEKFQTQEAQLAAEAEEQHALEYATGLGDRLEDDYSEESKP